MIVYSSDPWRPSSLSRGGRGGGPTTFMQYLGQYLRSRGHTTTNDSRANYDLHFVCGMRQENLLKSLRQGTPIIARLDGALSAANLSRFWKVYVKPAIIRHEMCHITVYQSRFCQRSWQCVSGGAMAGPSAIVRNGADPTRFFVNREGGTSKPDETPTVLLHEHFRHIEAGGIATALQAFALVHDVLPRTRLVLAGKLSGPVPGYVKAFLANAPVHVRQSIQVKGRTDHSMLPDLIRSADVFVHPVVNSACPHTVLEALACGIPVICYSGTGPAEFVGESGVILQSEYEGVHHGFKRFPNEDPQQLADAIIKVLAASNAYGSKARARASMFSSEITGNKYETVFREAIQRPPDKMPLGVALNLMWRLYSARLLAKLVAIYEGT